VANNNLEGLDIIEKYTSKNPVLVFVDLSYGNKVFEFNSVKDAVMVYRNSANFTTYIVGIEFDFMFVITDEDPILGAGAAADWLEKQGGV
jgi:hypothetical protein